MSEAELLEDFKQYLPKYLSPSGTENLFAELKQFPSNIDQRLYTSLLKAEPTIYQGDGLANLPIVNLPDARIEGKKAMVLSNTCDISPDNPRPIPARMIYCPIISFERYKAMLTASQASISEHHLSDIRAQKVSSMFFLPRNESLGEDAIVLLDRANNCNINQVPSHELQSRRLFTLSDYGFYLLIFKLSIHFTRIREAVRRTSEF
jgi:hypothetical protein